MGKNTSLVYTHKRVHMLTCSKMLGMLNLAVHSLCTACVQLALSPPPKPPNAERATVRVRNNVLFFQETGYCYPKRLPVAFEAPHSAA